MSFNPGGSPDFREQFHQDVAGQQSKQRSRTTWLVGCVGAVLLVLLIAGGSACGTYNSLATEREKVHGAFANIDTQLQRRADLVPNLVNTVKGYTKHEETVFADIANARTQLLNAKSVDEKSAANAQLTGALGHLLVLSENYPNLKADQQFIRLQDELAGTENRISVARRDYNQEVVAYNSARQRFPTVIMANLFGFQREEEFKADVSAREAPKVDFSK